MTSSKAKAKAKKPAAKARAPQKGKTTSHKPASKPASKAKPKAPAPPKPQAKVPAGKKPVSAPPKPAAPGDAKAAAAAAGAAKPAKPAKPPKKSRRAPAIRRGPDGEILQPGEILIPGGVHDSDEIHYLFRGSVAAEHAAGDTGMAEVLAKRPGESETELRKILGTTGDRFEKGPIESMLPQRPPQRRNFQGVVERAKHRRREIGAFLRGLDLGRTETSHMDSHGEASLQSLMEWAARLENLAEADEPDQADYAQFHRGLDQLENTTEALIVDVELTLRRVRDRARAR
jgi:hypothetical protein